jgi:plastocyanin
MTLEHTTTPRLQRRRRAIATVLGVLAMGAGALVQAGPAAAKAPTKHSVSAVETEFHIALSTKRFSPGTYTFVAKNEGHVTHALEITGPGVDDVRTPDLTPGQSAKLTVTLRAGKYDIFCPIPGHKSLGMNLNISVKSGGGKSTSSSSKGASGGGYGY